MFQGTGSDVGKSVIVAGLCRALVRRGLRVRPFKPQNMSNNAAVAAGGGEIGRAQALQARACGVEPTVDMNPVLLKPQSDVGAQVVVRGRVVGRIDASAYQADRARLLDVVVRSFETLGRDADIVLVEGAGSPAETNLRSGDIANMGFAVAAQVPVVVIGDIDRGGVIASLVGTHAVLDERDRALVRGTLINKFRGDVSLFDEGLVEIERRTRWRNFGVLPFVMAARRLPAEDAVALEEAAAPSSAAAQIAVPMLSRISNFDEFDALRLEPGVDLVMVPPGTPIPASAQLVIVPGTKSTRGDLEFVRAQGWDIDLLAHSRRGGRVLGVCGGYQMLGRRVSDPEGIEGEPGESRGLGLLDVDTVLSADKKTQAVRGNHLATDAAVSGYEIHAGRTTGAACSRAFLQLEGDRADGAVSENGLTMGTYVHGLFASDPFRAAFLERLGTASSLHYESEVDRMLDAFAAEIEAHVDVDAMLECSAVC